MPHDPTTDDHATGDAVRCAPWTMRHGIDPLGSAVRIDRLVAVEVPQPWPNDVGDLGWLAGIDVPDRCRIQAVVPAGAPADGVLVTRWERATADGRASADLLGTEWSVPAAELPAAVAAVCAGEDLPDGAPAPPEVLVCTHGTRDACCGGSGTRLAQELAGRLHEHRVRRTSHLGGHRFAPTAMTLPDGRSWAFLDTDDAVGIVERTLPAGDARELYRGNPALGPWGQVVEGSRLEAEGWGAFDAGTIAEQVEVDGDAAVVTLTRQGPSGTQVDVGTVVVSRRYPVPACGLPIEAATKTATEYALVAG